MNNAYYLNNLKVHYYYRYTVLWIFFFKTLLLIINPAFAMYVYVLIDLEYGDTTV